MLLPFLIKCFSCIATHCEEEWNKGSNGFITINNTIYAIIRIINDIVNIELEKSGSQTVQNINSFFPKCEPMLKDLCEILNDFNEDQIVKIKKAKGGGAKKESWRFLQVELHNKNKTFINSDLQTHIDNYCTDFNPQAASYLSEIKNTIFGKFRNKICHDEDWLKVMMPNNLALDVELRKTTASFKENRNVDVWEVISFADICSISSRNSNWTEFAKDLLKRNSVETNKVETLNWLQNLDRYDKRIEQNRKLSRQEFQELEIIYNDFCK